MIKSIELHESKRFWQSSSKFWVAGNGLTIRDEGDSVVLSKAGMPTEYEVAKSSCTIEHARVEKAEEPKPKGKPGPKPKAEQTENAA